ncbi:MAG: methyltransferase domain-containing protein [Candidatus Shapirobacteria bacterium]
MVKINLGSGPVSARGWTNYDWGLLPFLGKYNLTSVFIKLGLLSKEYNWKWPKISLVNIKEKLPDDDNSVDYIYCSHVLEHFKKEEALSVLSECKRVLKYSGRIRIVLPDLRKFIENYSSSEIFNREYFGFDKDLYIGFMGKIKRFFIRGHEWMYDKDSGKKLLEDAGFRNVKVCAFRKGLVPDLKSLDIEQHKKTSFYLEAENR